MLTFSINQPTQQVFLDTIIELTKGKERIPSEELSLIAEYAYKKAYGSVKSSFKTYSYSKRKFWKGSEVMFKSEKQKKYMPDMVSLEEHQEMVECLYYNQDLYKTSIEEAQVDTEWALEFFKKEWRIVVQDFGVDMLRLLVLGLEGDRGAVNRLKKVLEKLEKLQGESIKKDLQYAIGLIIMTPELNEQLKNGNNGYALLDMV